MASPTQTTQTTRWALVLLLAAVLVAALNLAVLRDGEVAFAALLGGTVAIAALVAARIQRNAR